MLRARAARGAPALTSPGVKGAATASLARGLARATPGAGHQPLVPPTLCMKGVLLIGVYRLRPDHVAASARPPARRLPDVSALSTVVHEVLPLLATWALHHEAEPSPPNQQLQGAALPGGDWGAGVPAAVAKATVENLGRSELARRLVQVGGWVG